MKKSKSKPIKLSKAKARAWSAFSKYIRTKYSVGGMVNCITCGILREVKKMQAGHFIPGHHNAVMFDERNVHPQCDYCNRILGSNGPKYYQYMQKNYGVKVIRELQKLDTKAVKYTVDDYLSIEQKYLHLLDLL